MQGTFQRPLMSYLWCVFPFFFSYVYTELASWAHARKERWWRKSGGKKHGRRWRWRKGGKWLFITGNNRMAINPDWCGAARGRGRIKRQRENGWNDERKERRCRNELVESVIANQTDNWVQSKLVSLVLELVPVWEDPLLSSLLLSSAAHLSVY